MKTIRTIAILAVFLLVLTCTTGQVSAGVEPSPFKSKTVENKIRVARYQMVIMGCTLDRFNDKASELNNKGSLIRAVNQINVLQGQARGTLRTLESARSMLEDCERPDYEDLSDALDGFSEYLENLRDKVADFEGDPNFPKVLIGPLRELGDILQDIQTEADSFLSVNVD
jgi:hypothetical protein